MGTRVFYCANLIVWLLTAAFVSAADGDVVEFVQRHCVHCHGAEATAGINLEAASQGSLNGQADTWERALRKVTAHQMPPVDQPQPTAAEASAFAAELVRRLDEAYAQAPRIAKTEALRRLTRVEYQNSIRDLLGVDIDASSLLPPDESSHGFDNITVSDLSPAWLSRAISAAQKISHLAVGAQSKPISGETFRIRADITQEQHVPGLPLGTRGGTLIKTHLARPGQYEITVRLARDRNEEVEGLYEPHVLEIILDRTPVASFTVEPPPGRRDFSIVDKHLRAQVPIGAGPHAIGVTFRAKSPSLLETKRQPYNAHFNMHRHPRLGPAVYEVSITGPTADADSESHAASGPLGVQSEGKSAEQSARDALSKIMRRAYRRPVTDEDLAEPMEIFAQHRDAGYTIAMEHALAAVLVSPHFLFRIERAPVDAQAGKPYRLSDLELASRLSFFLWSSLPDEELLDLAESSRLSEPEQLEMQIARMLRDTRSQSLVDNFAEQWLYLRNLESMTPDLRLFPDFDDNLRQAFRQETRLCFERILREDRSVMELLRSDTTYLNERLARHYGIPHIYGSRFRPVDLRQLPAPEGRRAADGSEAGAELVDPSTNFSAMRGGLLRQGSILTVTSYATRTSPVLRGHWVLKNIVGAPPPPPPADVPALKDNTVDSQLSMRQRLAQHREQAACAVCHNLLDPVGFALENYDAVGRWREVEDGQAIDARGGLSGHGDFVGVQGLEQALLSQPELFVSTMTEKLMTYALGRGMDASDGPAIRSVVRQSGADDYRFASIIAAIVQSPPFKYRSAP